MSGCGFSEKCPNCGEDMDCYSDHKPFNQESGECLECGFSYMTIPRFMDLEELNELRVDMELEPIRKKDMIKQDDSILMF